MPASPPTLLLPPSLPRFLSSPPSSHFSERRGLHAKETKAVQLSRKLIYRSDFPRSGRGGIDGPTGTHKRVVDAPYLGSHVPTAHLPRPFVRTAQTRFQYNNTKRFSLIHQIKLAE
ncbi:hypothetical protein AVEN_239401-1 [Araneus ventricosus]|uniref:Uncharacterized protein n=1 Tax=Araneus ventricosus TaxID=182803 RepID=A0A4Y2LHS4_ARAVE|nr:hypothetical protein AVEN_239401-1 [Araneus ventricosus]